MQNDINFPVIAIINDLDALIAEIDENPRLSSWVVRVVLKAIKEKARKMANETPQQAISPKQPVYFQAVSRRVTIAKKQTGVSPSIN